jgi:hypothetical protein
LGYALVRSRSRTPDSYTFGTYGLIDPQYNTWVTHDPVGRGYGWRLDDIQSILQ